MSRTISLFCTFCMMGHDDDDDVDDVDVGCGVVATIRKEAP
jgi:hypothetical protein